MLHLQNVLKFVHKSIVEAYTWEVVEKIGALATSPICLIPLMLAAFGEMSQIVLVAGTPVFSTTIYTIENKIKIKL